MEYTQERYNPQVVGVNGSVTITGASIGGFLAKTSGTISFMKAGSNPLLLIDAVPVTAGAYTPLPFHVGQHGGTFTTGGGASGTLAVG